MVPLSLKVHGMLVGGREAGVCLEGGREGGSGYVGRWEAVGETDGGALLPSD